MGTGSSSVVVRREGRRSVAFVLLLALGTLSAASCSGRSTSHQQSGGSGGSSTGAAGGVGGSTGGNVGKSVGGSGNVSGTGGKGATGGAAGKGASGGISGTAGSGATGAFPCVDEQAASPDLVGCDSGFVHRPTPMACPPLEVPQDDSGGQGGEGGAGGPCLQACASDETCIWTTPNEAHPFQECARVCETDSECPTGSICVCVPGLFLTPRDVGPGATAGVCRETNCTTDADCPAGLLCIAPLSVDSCRPVPLTFHCQTPMDECAGPEHCESDACSYKSGRFVCSDEGC